MDCKRVVFGGHVVQRMFERGISRDEYADDKPYPSHLLLGSMETKPLHVVLASDEAAGLCIVVTVYEPALEHWNSDFRTRKMK